ncbi:hypothetical protein [Mesorhizobium sp. J428]|uniref:hypothetical protein n=1 Tax=Mesorhizobium sp. J428 TaxID=2898440 RepID=UPI0035B1D548
MTEAPQPAQLPVPTPPGVYEHICEHPGCRKWGSFGFARNQRDEPRWFCFEHRSDGGN